MALAQRQDGPYKWETGVIARGSARQFQLAHEQRAMVARRAPELAEKLASNTPSLEIVMQIVEELKKLGIDIHLPVTARLSETRKMVERALVTLMLEHNVRTPLRVHEGDMLSDEESTIERRVVVESIDISNEPEFIDEWITSIGELMWRNSHQRLTPSQRKGGYIYHVPKAGDWAGLRSLIENADQFLLMLNTAEEEEELIGFIEMKELEQALVDRMTNVKGKVSTLLRENLSDGAHMQLIVIDESYRGRGLGKKLHYEARDQARKSGYKILFLEVPIMPDRNTVSYEFHEHGVHMIPVAQTVEEDPYFENTTHGFEIFIVGLIKRFKNKVRKAVKAHSERRRKKR